MIELVGQVLMVSGALLMLYVLISAIIDLDSRVRDLEIELQRRNGR